MDDARHQLRNKLLLRLVAPLTFLTFLSSLDRVNVSFAALQMNQALGLSPERYGVGVSLFFVGYLAFQFPHTALLRRIGARRWIFAAVFTWGVTATLMTFVRDATDFYVLRVLLGVAEAGFAPGIVTIMSDWMPRRFRASAIAGSMLAVPISIVFGGPLSGWLMSAEVLGMPGWRFMFLAEGGLTVLVALLAPLYFVDTPAQARWLRADEQAWLAEERARDAQALTQTGEPALASLRQVVASPRIWAAAGVWFSLMSGAYGIIFWLPTVVKQLSGLSDLTVSALSALPWLSLGIGMQVNAWHSDRTQERHLHVALPILLAAFGLGVGASMTPGWPALLCLVVGAFGLGSAQGTFWALPTTLLEGAALGSGITLINLLGNVGGLLAPPTIGWVRGATGSFALAVYTLCAALVLGALLVFAMRSLKHVPRPARDEALAPPLEELPR